MPVKVKGHWGLFPLPGLGQINRQVADREQNKLTSLASILFHIVLINSGIQLLLSFENGRDVLFWD